MQSDGEAPVVNGGYINHDVLWLDVMKHNSSISGYRRIWRQVDATVGQPVETCSKQWKMNVLSDGCFVEYEVMDLNV
jgi:hypothetical protein